MPQSITTPRFSTSSNSSLENDRLVVAFLHALPTFDVERLAVASDIFISYY